MLAFIIAFINKRNAKKAAEALANGEEIPAACRPDSCAGCINAACCGKLTTEIPVKAAEALAKAEAADAKRAKKPEEAQASSDKDAANNNAAEDDKSEEVEKDEPRLSPYAPTRESVLADIKLVPNATGKILREHAQEQDTDNTDEKQQAVSGAEAENGQKSVEAEQKTESQPAAEPQQAVDQSAETQPAAEQPQQYTETQAQPSAEQPEQPAEDEPSDSDIKLKETMAHIKKKKGKGGKR